MDNSCTFSHLSAYALYPDSILITVELAQSSSPPIGAKMIPNAKKIGRTVLGVRIGLVQVSMWIDTSRWSRTYCHAFNLCCRKAVSKHRQRQRSQKRTMNILAGFLLFCFFGASLCGSSAVIESSLCKVWVLDISYTVSCVPTRSCWGVRKMTFRIRFKLHITQPQCMCWFSPSDARRTFFF